jgi:hypothetical protein
MQLKQIKQYLLRKYQSVKLLAMNRRPTLYFCITSQLSSGQLEHLIQMVPLGYMGRQNKLKQSGHCIVSEFKIVWKIFVHLNICVLLAYVYSSRQITSQL